MAQTNGVASVANSNLADAKVVALRQRFHGFGELSFVGDDGCVESVTGASRYDWLGLAWNVRC